VASSGFGWLRSSHFFRSKSRQIAPNRAMSPAAVRSRVSPVFRSKRMYPSLPITPTNTFVEPPPGQAHLPRTSVPIAAVLSISNCRYVPIAASQPLEKRHLSAVVGACQHLSAVKPLFCKLLPFTHHATIHQPGLPTSPERSAKIRSPLALVKTLPIRVPAFGLQVRISWLPRYSPLAKQPS
jgi:hypothetical protein